MTTTHPSDRTIEVAGELVVRRERPGAYGRGAVSFRAAHAILPPAEATRRSSAGAATVEYGDQTRLMLPETARQIIATLSAAVEFAEQSVPVERLCEILDALNAREAIVSDTWRTAPGVFPEIDRGETEGADEGGFHDRLVLCDGTLIRFDHLTQRWEV